MPPFLFGLTQSEMKSGHCTVAKCNVFLLQGALTTNEQATVTFRFVTSPEYIRIGSTLLFRERTTKGIGQITKLYPFNCEHPNLVPSRRKVSSSNSPQASPQTHHFSTALDDRTFPMLGATSE